MIIREIIVVVSRNQTNPTNSNDIMLGYLHLVVIFIPRVKLQN
jgi:hypothetical protein